MVWRGRKLLVAGCLLRVTSYSHTPHYFQKEAVSAEDGYLCAMEISGRYVGFAHGY